jgi:hypothetical protein
VRECPTADQSKAKARGQCHAQPLKEKNRQNARVHPVKLAKDVNTVISSDNRKQAERN